MDDKIEVDGLGSVTGEVVALEYWRASETLPAELLRMLPQPPVSEPG